MNSIKEETKKDEKSKNEDEKDTTNSDKIDEKIKKIEEREKTIKYKISQKMKEIFELKNSIFELNNSLKSTIELKNKLKMKRNKKIQNPDETKKMEKPNFCDGKDNAPKKIEEKANTQGKETNNIVGELKKNDTDYNAEVNKKYSIKNEDVNNNDKNGGNYNINVTSKEDDHETANNNGHCGEKKLSEKKGTEGIDSKKEKSTNVEGKKEYVTEEKKDVNEK